MGRLRKKKGIKNIKKPALLASIPGLSTKLQGSIVEPVVAVVILVTTIAMSFTILTRANITPLIQAKNKANELISTELYYTLTESDFIDKEIQQGAFKLVKGIEQIQDNNALLITIQVFDSEEKEIMSQQVVYPTLSFKDE